ncbi:MAG: hypothetical protein CMJ58_24520 [Planctomycetaceae bacterium]|nr:hypothetical protein [Planctomycetaceae bacterium]
MTTATCYQRLRRPREWRVLRLLLTTQFWSRERIRQYQFGKLKRLLRHAFDNVPYYRRQFDQIGATPDDIRRFEDLVAVPVLTKQDIRAHASELKASNLAQHEFLPNATGGSTGEPLQYFQDRRFELWASAARWRGWYSIADCVPGDRCAVLWGCMHELKSDFSRWERLSDLLLNGEIKLNSFNLSDDRKWDLVRRCQKLRPTLLRGYFTAVKDFARFIDENKVRLPPLKGVLLCAETVDAPSRDYVERVLQARTYNTYGGREASLMAMECAAHAGLHEVSENNYLEFEPITLPGHPDAGNILVTNLNNYAMPFIRYRIGDIGVPSSAESCDCGRGLPLIRRVIGRTTEVFRFVDGTRIAGEMFIHLMKDLPLNEYQFVQTSDATVVLRTRRQDAVDDALRRRIANTYRPYLPSCVTLRFEEVDHFVKTPTGKFRFVFREPAPCD